MLRPSLARSHPTPYRQGAVGFRKTKNYKNTVASLISPYELGRRRHSSRAGTPDGHLTAALTATWAYDDKRRWTKPPRKFPSQIRDRRLRTAPHVPKLTFNPGVVGSNPTGPSKISYLKSAFRTSAGGLRQRFDSNADSNPSFAAQHAHATGPRLARRCDSMRTTSASPGFRLLSPQCRAP